MVACCLLLAAFAAAEEEAVHADGRRTTGTLTLDAGGRLRFAPKDGSPALSADGLGTIRFPAAAPAATRPRVGVRVTLRDGQRICGQLLSLNDKLLSLRSSWAERLELPRAAIASITQLPGWRTLLTDAFQESAWTLKGQPSLDAKKGRLTLNESGQTALLTLAKPLENGRVGLTFTPNDATGGRWTCALEFGEGVGRRTVRVTLAGIGDAYDIDTGGLDGTARRVARTPGLHHLLVHFSERSLRISIDEQVLWYTLDAGPGGELRQLRLACERTEKLQETVVFSEAFIARAVDEPPHPSGDLTQDEAYRGDGDQLFGRLVRADSRNVEFDDNGPRSIPWSALHGVFPRRDTLAPQSTSGAHVRLALRTELSAEPDVLDGVATAIDDKALSLHHALLGDLRLDRACLHTLQPLFHGLRQEIDNAFHHLGDPRAFSPRLQPPRAESLELKRTLTLEAVPDAARLVLNVVQLPGVKETDARVTVYLNGERLDDLNHHFDKASNEPHRLTLPLPKARLLKGANVLELKLTPSPETRRVEPCGVFGLALEVPR